MLHTAVRDFNISEMAKKLVLLSIDDAEISYLNMVTFGENSNQNKHIWYEQPRWENVGLLPNGMTNVATT